LAFPYRPTLDLDPTGSGDRGAVAKWLLGLGATIALAAGLGALQFYQASSEGAAKDALRRTTAALTEIDALLARHEGDLLVRAENTAPEQPLELEDYPISVELTADEVLSSSHDDLRALVLERSADRLYGDGTGVLRERAEASGSIGRFSVAGITDRGLGLLTSDTHARSGIAAIVLLAIATGLALGSGYAAHGWGRAGVMGVILAAASTAILVGGLLLLLYARTAGGDGSEYVREEFMGAASDLAMIPIANGAAGLLAGLITALTAHGAATLTRESRRPLVEAA
jgi:hypothetical protein